MSWRDLHHASAALRYFLGIVKDSDGFYIEMYGGEVIYRPWRDEEIPSAEAVDLRGLLNWRGTVLYVGSMATEHAIHEVKFVKKWCWRTDDGRVEDFLTEAEARAAVEEAVLEAMEEKP